MALLCHPPPTWQNKTKENKAAKKDKSPQQWSSKHYRTHAKPTRTVWLPTRAGTKSKEPAVPLKSKVGSFLLRVDFYLLFFLSFSIVKTNCADARGSGAHFWKSPFKRSLGAHFLQTRVCLFFACCGTVLLQGFCLLWPLFVARIFACCGTFLFALQLQTFLFVSKEGKAALHLKPTACF